MNDSDWDLLLRRIAKDRCTPFLGAGAAASVLPLGSKLAKQWAEIEGYPLEDTHVLASVAQYLGVKFDDAMEPKDRVVELLDRMPDPNFASAKEPHGVLARLPFSIYMTTNYDRLMLKALRYYKKDPQTEVCRWNSSPAVKTAPGVFRSDPAFTPTPANPVVYHLHGHAGLPESIVLTEDDYFDFLVAISRNKDLLPYQIERAFSGTTLLFIGYSLADWDFRVLHRGIVMAGEKALRRLSLTVQLPRVGQAERVREYLNKYFGAMNVHVYWGTASDFAQELWNRWQEASDG